MNSGVINWLRSEGHFTAEKILERDSWNTKKTEKYSNAVVDGMEESRAMRALYKEFKENLEIARSSRVSCARTSSFMNWLTVFRPRDTHMGVDSLEWIVVANLVLRWIIGIRVSTNLDSCLWEWWMRWK